jgi:HlyD family secretion protein
MIRDTSAQDRRIEPVRSHKRWIVVGAAGAAVLVALIWVVPTIGRLISAGSSISSGSVRIAAVRRGTLTRDISAQGKVVAAVSPTLYATTAGIVTLDIHAGDKVEKDQVLAEIYSPELNNKLEQEQATFNSLGIDVERTGIDNKQKQLAAKKTFDQASIDRQTAAREVDRNERGFKAGAIPEINMLRAKDALAKADLDVEHAQADAKLLDETLAFELKTRRFALEKQKLLVAELQRQVDQLSCWCSRKPTLRPMPAC